jgi:hypothetical protein
MAATTKKSAGGAKPAATKAAGASATARPAAAKPAAAKPAAAKPARVEPPAAPTETASAAPGQLRLKELLGRVTSTTGAKPREVREIVGATLAEIGQALARGEGLNLPDLGRARVTRRSGDAEAGHTLVVKLRQAGATGAKAGKEPLAEVDD